MTSPTATAIAAVDELLVALDWLAASLLPGTHRPYRAPMLSPELRAERDRLARLERLERIGIAPGETPPVMDLDVADLISEILSTADELCDRTCLAVWRPSPRPAGSAFANPMPFLRVVTANLRLAATVDMCLPGEVETRCDGLTFRAHTTLGLFGDGQVLTALCPWCDGRTSGAPTGGARTMRVRALLPDGVPMAKVDPKDVRWFVVCEGLCAPPTSDCGERLRGRPAWPLKTEGDWLAKRLEAAMAS